MDLATAVRWSDPGYIVEEKFDGSRAVVWVDANGVRVTGRREGPDGMAMPMVHHRGLPDAGWAGELSGCIFDGELMENGSYIVFDCMSIRGQDIRRLPFRERRAALESLADWMPEQASIIRQFRTVSEMGDFGEGVVWKSLKARYGFGFYKARRVVTHDVMVHRVVGNGVVETLGRGKVCGCPDGLKMGDIIEVIAFREFVRTGSLRNGRFLRVRDDK